MKTLSLFISLILLSGCSNLYADGIMDVTTTGYPYDFMRLMKTEATVEIIDQVVITTVKNTFFNDADNPIEALYHFPVPVSASVTGMGRYYNGQLVEFELEPGQQGGTGGGTSNPSLEEYLGENPFTIQISDIEPGEIAMYFQFSGLLSYSFGNIVMEYPLWTPSEFVMSGPDSITFDIDLTSQRIMTDVFCNNYVSNTTITVLNNYEASAEFQLFNTYPQEDFDICYTVSQEDIGCWLLTNTEPDSLPDSDHGYFMLIAEPGEIETGDILQKYFTFILDKSGSMNGYPIAQAKEAAITCISMLNPEDYFNVIDFAAVVDQYSIEPVLASPANIADAIDYIDAISAGGGTNINSALLTGLAQEMGDSSANQIIFLTDGMPTAGVTNIEQILANVSAANNDTAGIFCFGIGISPGNQLLEGLAQQNWGATIYLELGQPIGEPVILFFQSIMSPVFINVTVDFGTINTRDVFPNDLFNIYYGSQTLIFGRYTNFGTTDISLSGTIAGYDTTLIYSGFEFSEENPENEFLPRMWAIEYINYWLSWMAINGEDDEIIDMIIFYSLKYGILTPYTNYQPVEDIYVVNLNGLPQSNGIMITWSISDYCPGINYDVLRSDNPFTGFSKLNERPFSDSYYFDSSANPGSVYYYKIIAHTLEGDIISGVFQVGNLPEDFLLSQNYPNPFNSSTTMAYSLPMESKVKLQIFNLVGQSIAVLADGIYKSGVHYVQWDGRDDKGFSVASGYYFYRLTAESLMNNNEYSHVRRLLLVK